MAEKGAAPGKLVLKPGVICQFMGTFANSADNECMQFTEVAC